MSFWPLARTITEQLKDASQSGPLVELGAGEGRLVDRLRELGLDCWGVDRRYPPAPSRLMAIAADVLALPLRERALSGAICANLLRQIPSDTRLRFAGECKRVLRGGACLVILEDHPEARDEAERNYRDCLEELCQVHPERGAGVLDARECELEFAPILGSAIAAGSEENEERVADPLAPIRWMEMVAPHRGNLSVLRERIERYGMSYGRYWYRIFVRGT